MSGKTDEDYEEMSLRGRGRYWERSGIKSRKHVLNLLIIPDGLSIFVSYLITLCDIFVDRCMSSSCMNEETFSRLWL